MIRTSSLKFGKTRREDLYLVEKYLISAAKYTMTLFSEQSPGIKMKLK
jgi:hypothetical protein